MPITSSAIKKNKQDKVKTARNKMKRENLRDSIKAVEDAAKAGAANLKDLFQSAQKTIDKCTKWNIIQKGTAARRKSSLNKLVKDAGKSAPKTTAKKA